jgi:tetratricopeptide (TPR) repeat protein
VTRQLLDGTSGATLWSETYTRRFENVFEIETEIAMQIASALEAEFSLAEQQAVGTQLTSSTQAWSLYVSAVELWQSTGPRPDVLATVNERLDAAIRFDPAFAAAYGVKADIAAELLFSDVGMPDSWQARSQALYAEAEQWARTAIRLDPTYGYPYSVLGKLYWQNWQVEDAAAAYARAIELSPNDPEALVEYSWFNGYVGRQAEAERAAGRVAELDPGNADLVFRAGQSFAMGGHYERAAELYRAALDVDPAYDFANVFLGVHLAGNGDVVRGGALVDTGNDLLASVEVGWMLGELTYAYGRVGREADARRLFERMQRVAESRRIGPVSWAFACLGIGDEARALEWLGIAASNRFPDEGSMFRGLVVRNLWDDLRLEQPEFVVARTRLESNLD